MAARSLLLDTYSTPSGPTTRPGGRGSPVATVVRAPPGATRTMLPGPLKKGRARVLQHVEDCRRHPSPSQ